MTNENANDELELEIVVSETTETNEDKIRKLLEKCNLLEDLAAQKAKKNKLASNS